MNSDVRHNVKRSVGVVVVRAWMMVMILVVIVRPGAGMTRIRDIARPLGERTNKLFGHGLVVGLNGTGDGDAVITTQPYRELLQRLDNPVAIEDLKNAKNVAYVMVTAELGRNGVRNGDRIDVYVHSAFSAKSLKGGTLLMTPLLGMHYADDNLYGWAQGPVTVPDDAVPTSGVIKGGADLEEDLIYEYLERDARTKQAYFTLVLDDNQANWQASKAIAQIINEETAPPGVMDLGNLPQNQTALEPTAVALGTKNIRVMLTAKQARFPSQFIARIMDLQVTLPDPEAVVVVNEKTGVIVVTGNVEIAPVMVTVNGLSIRIVEPQPQPSPEQPQVTQTEWVKFDTDQTGGVNIEQLRKAFDLLNVPVRDRINAIYEINRAGALRARIRSEY